MSTVASTSLASISMSSACARAGPMALAGLSAPPAWQPAAPVGQTAAVAEPSAPFIVPPTAAGTVFRCWVMAGSSGVKRPAASGSRRFDHSPRRRCEKNEQAARRKKSAPRAARGGHWGPGSRRPSGLAWVRWPGGLASRRRRQRGRGKTALTAARSIAGCYALRRRTFCSKLSSKYPAWEASMAREIGGHFSFGVK